MIIELKGVEFVNKGAELMLRAILERVKEEFEDAVFVMNRGSNIPLRRLRENNIYVKLNGGRYSRIITWMPLVIRRKLGFVLDKEVNVILDGSGFALGDQWGAEYAERRLGSRIKEWREQGKKVILLPQAFGPFEDPRLKQVMKKILLHADLVFAREEMSFKHVKSIHMNGNLRQAPDFTVLVKGKMPADFDSTKYHVAIVPNRKMIGKLADKGESYIQFLLASIKTVYESGLTPYFLIHEGKGDIIVAKKVNSLLDKPLDIIIREDPLHVKGIISSAYFIICSRFHGVVSALSQGVPCIVTSWSHKYEMLLKEYDYEEGLVRDLGDHAKTAEMVRRLTDPSVHEAVSRKLSYNSRIQREMTINMWKTVFNVLNN